MLLAIAVLAITGAAAWWWLSGGPSTTLIDLIERFPEAEKRTTMASLHEGFGIEDVRIGSDARRAIFAHPPSRIIWRLTVPDGSVLETACAIRPDAWKLDGDGATFRVGVSDGRSYREFVRQWIDPYHREADRRWFPVTVDLGEWAGREIEIIFNTEPNFNAVHDAAVWGAPGIRRR